MLHSHNAGPDYKLLPLDRAYAPLVISPHHTHFPPALRPRQLLFKIPHFRHLLCPLICNFHIQAGEISTGYKKEHHLRGEMCFATELIENLSSLILCFLNSLSLK